MNVLGDGLVLVLVAVLAASCSGESNNGAGTDAGTDVGADAGTDVATVPSQDADQESDQGEATIDAAPAADADEPDATETTAVAESEPNDGATLEEFDAVEVGQVIAGAIAMADTDIFHVPTAAGKLYEVSLGVDADSPLQGHVTVLDDGRDGDAAGNDYVKITRDGTLRFLAMGEGAHYVAVRDARNVDGGAAGGTDHTYTLVVTEIAATEAVQGAVAFGTALSGSLAGAGDVHLWTFDGTEGDFVTFDFSTNGELDGRLYVFSQETGSWIARQDDRTASDPNPLLDAPLTESGAMVLVVENIADQATSLGYSIDAAGP